MLKIERQKKIEEYLHLYGSILISDMSQKLDCSEETIRRDLREMEKDSKLIKIHGGAFLPESDDKGAPQQLRETIFSEKKENLANYTINHFIKDNDTIMLDCSTTCLALAKQLLYSNIKVTIITNSLRIFNLFDQQLHNLKLIALGGTFRQRSNSFVGYQTTDTIKHLISDKCFISCSAIDIKHGLIDNNMSEAQVRKSYIYQSRKRFLIADHTKFSDTADYIINDLTCIDAIITDKKLSEEWQNKINELNIPIYFGNES
ncbi:MAG: DeoR/GlpR family DNA-binding transcription regulator [Velocimicrobium sp.]